MTGTDSWGRKMERGEVGRHDTCVCNMADDNEDCYGSIGFMFDAEHAKITETIQLGDYSVQLRIIGDDPGHVQSGQYLWPAAKYLGKYLLENWACEGRKVIVELGSGAGFCGIIAALLGGATTNVFLTDYDPGCIDILTVNIVLNQCECNTRVESLSWGKALPESLLAALETGAGDLLLLASDVIYSTSVVGPLFETVLTILKYGGCFLLASSFDIGEVSMSVSALMCDNYQCIGDKIVLFICVIDVNDLILFCFRS